METKEECIAHSRNQKEPSKIRIKHAGAEWGIDKLDRTGPLYAAHSLDSEARADCFGAQIREQWNLQRVAEEGFAKIDQIGIDR